MTRQNPRKPQIPQPEALGNCPKCRTPLGPQIKLCLSCGARVDEVPSVDRPRRG